MIEHPEPPHMRGPTSAPARTRSVLINYESKGIDLDKFKLDSAALQTAVPSGEHTRTPKSKTSRERIQGEEFLAGPIRIPWLEVAAKLPGAAFQIAVLLRHHKNLKRTDTVKLSNKAVEQFGVSPDAKRRALIALQDAGLITMSSATGRSPIVTLIGD